jgi:type VI protein secretion system component VasF
MLAAQRAVKPNRAEPSPPFLLAGGRRQRDGMRRVTRSLAVRLILWIIALALLVALVSAWAMGYGRSH